MAIIVPITKRQEQPPPAPPVSDTYLAMAAAQMHSMNRLLEPDDYLRSVGKTMIKDLSHIPAGSEQSPAEKRGVQAREALDISNKVPR